jgi:RHS repeat-associated protein
VTGAVAYAFGNLTQRARQASAEADFAAAEARGNVVARLSYDAWGQARNAQTWSGPPAQGRLNAVLDITRAGYTGHEMLWASGTVHMNGRVYDPGTGRMISADPTIPQMWNAQTHNRYAYVYNNPLSLVDPTGFSGEEPTPGATPLDSVEVTGQRIYTNPFNFRFALTTPWESQPTVDPHGFLLNQLANSAEEEAAAAAGR